MIHSVYGYPVYVGKASNKEAIFEHMKDFLNKTPVQTADRWNCSCLTTSSHGCSSNVNQYHSNHVIEMVEEHKTAMLNELGIKDNIETVCSLCRDPECIACMDLWINIYGKGMEQGEHWHIQGTETDPFFSFVYFVRYNPKTDAKLVFLNPAPETPCKKLLDLNSYKRNTTVDVNEGDVIIFPSFMVHYVEEQKTDGPRITIAGNLYEVLKD